MYACSFCMYVCAVYKTKQTNKKKNTKNKCSILKERRRRALSFVYGFIFENQNLMNKFVKYAMSPTSPHTMLCYNY